MIKIAARRLANDLARPRGRLNAREIGCTDLPLLVPASAGRGKGSRMFDVRRRQFITLLGGAVATWPIAARGQQQPKMLRVGFVGMQPREAPHYTNFLKRMAELGYQEGRNFTFDYIQTLNVEGYDRNYRELAARKVD